MQAILEKDAEEQEQDILAAEQNRIVEKMKKETKGILTDFSISKITKDEFFSC